jgi:predicted O-methyltransferase YrrM
MNYSKSMKDSIRKIVDKLPYISKLRRQVDEQGAWLAGHFYSPIPARDDVISNLKKPSATASLPDVNLRHDAQRELLEQYTSYYQQVPFPAEKTSGFRYYFNQDFFGYADAIFLYSFIQHFKPKRIIEIGSGFSSAVMLDTLERFPYGKVDVTFIEPYPARLLGTLKAEDKASVKIIEKKVQEVDPGLFNSLQAGDLLFVDSSHVVKYGSDVQKVFYDVLPKLPVGVFVHFHDIFFPFEYPATWLSDGRYWNENYFLRSFLSYNDSWEIVFFNHYAVIEFKDRLAEKMPLCLKNTGGSIYLKRVK